MMQIILLFCTLLGLALSGSLASPILVRAPDSTEVWITVTVYVTPSSSATPITNRPDGVKNVDSSKQTDQNFDYAQAVLDAHNEHRDNHSVAALKWSDDLASIAQEHARTCYYKHNTNIGGGGYGQNIGAGADAEHSPAMISNLMYNGEFGFYPGYDGEPDMENFEKWGHFSQILWKETEEVGCATVYCPGGLGNTGKNISPYFLVCDYKPSGRQLRS
jgi:hypothetical protein